MEYHSHIVTWLHARWFAVWILAGAIGLSLQMCRLVLKLMQPRLRWILRGSFSVG